MRNEQRVPDVSGAATFDNTRRLPEVPLASWPEDLTSRLDVSRPLPDLRLSGSKRSMREACDAAAAGVVPPRNLEDDDGDASAVWTVGTTGH
jgi:hypothetical protein